MPVFNNPRQAIITEGGGDGWELIALIIVCVVGVGAAVAFIVEYAVLIAVSVAVFAVVVIGFAVWCRWAASPKRFARSRVPLPPVQRARVISSRVPEAIEAKRPAQLDSVVSDESYCPYERDSVPDSAGPERRPVARDLGDRPRWPDRPFRDGRGEAP